MNREDLKLVPMALYGLSKGVLEYIVKPRVVDDVGRIRELARAAIYHYSTDGREQTKIEVIPLHKE